MSHWAEQLTCNIALCHGRDLAGYAADNAPPIVAHSFLQSAGDAWKT